MAASTRMSDDQFTEMKERINRLLLDNQDLVQVNMDLRATMVRLKVEKTQLTKRESTGASVPLPDLGVEVLKDLVEWFFKPNMSPLSEIVERARLAIKTIEDQRGLPVESSLTPNQEVR